MSRNPLALSIPVPPAPKEGVYSLRAGCRSFHWVDADIERIRWVVMQREAGSQMTVIADELGVTLSRAKTLLERGLNLRWSAEVPEEFVF